jgi:hypothetical protein
MSQDIYKMFSSQYSKKISLLSQQTGKTGMSANKQTGERYGKKKSSGISKATKKKDRKKR